MNKFFRRRSLLAWYCFFVSISLTGYSPGNIRAQKTPNDRPNIILIMSDDMGYSDIGSYGSEIATPNLDKLARNGIRYTQFYNGARCCPTRASLMTGLYPHQAGMGWMIGTDYNLPGYEAELNKNCVTIAEVLKQSGYNTYMTGKWHLVKEVAKQQKYNWPLQRGFDKFYGIIMGASNYYDPAALCRNNTLITPYTDASYKPASYYLTDAISDNSVQYIKEHDTTKPFFMYVAYTAAHWPMQAPESAIQNYKGKYDQGWEKIRGERFDKMKRLGILEPAAELSPSDGTAWKDEKDKAAMARRMETYAAMVTIMDQGIGRLVDQLKKQGLFENTIILYLQDNGGCAEIIGGGATSQVSNTDGSKPLRKDEIHFKNSPPFTRDGKPVMQGKQLMAGPPDVYVSYLQNWANVSNTPFRQYKHWVHEGGIATPLIVHWPKGIKNKNEIRTQAGHVIDILPTLAELGGAKYPKEYNNNSIVPAAGVSLVPTFTNKPLAREAIYWEHEMNRAVRMGKWKLVAAGELIDSTNRRREYYTNGSWELYDMEKDRSELHDLSSRHPDIVSKMSAMWEQYANTTNVFPAPWKLKN